MTPEQKQKILYALSHGVPVTMIADKLGISRRTMFHWLKYNKEFKAEKQRYLTFVENIFTT
jgi:transposase-like protein